jgi:hypothetical protein
LGKLYLDVVLPPRTAFADLLADRADLLRARDEARRALAAPAVGGSGGSPG